MLTIHCPGCSLCVRAAPEAIAADPGCPRCGTVLVVPLSPVSPHVPFTLPTAPEPAAPPAPPDPEPDALSFVGERRHRQRRKIARRLVLKVVVVALLGVAAVFAVRAALHRVNEVQNKRAFQVHPRDVPSRWGIAGFAVCIVAHAARV